MHPRCRKQVAWRLRFQATGYPGIINKPLLLHLVGVYIIYITDARSNKHQMQFQTAELAVKYDAETCI